MCVCVCVKVLGCHSGNMSTGFAEIHWCVCLTGVFIGRLSCTLVVLPPYWLVGLYIGLNNDALAGVTGWLCGALMLERETLVNGYIYFIKLPPCFLHTH